MDRFQRFALTGAVLSSFVGALSAQAPAAVPAAPSEQQRAATATNFAVSPAVVYAKPDGVELVADFYMPKGLGPFPAIVFIHGGGWSSGNRTQLHRQAAYMAERGFVGMAIEYRLAPAHPFPAALEDAKQAVRWLRDHAAEYHIDPTRIAAAGSSAGAHLSAMLGVESSAASATGSNVEAVVAFNGIFDLSTMPSTAMISDFAGGPCAKTEAVCREASPISHVVAGGPAFFVLHGTADQTAPYSQAQVFVDKLRAAGDKVVFYTAEGGPHTFWSKPAWSAISDEKLAAFLQQQLGQRR